MRILTSQQMKAVEALSDNMGVHYRTLMLSAGDAAASFISRVTPVQGKSTLVLCGGGNNGGDGYVVAQLLARAGARVKVLAVQPPKTPLAQEMYTDARRLVMSLDEQDVEALCAESQLIIDGILGTGFFGKLDGSLAQVCAAVNASDAQVFALDIPTGVNADTGAADPQAVHARYTITFDSAKPGHFLYPGRQHCGELFAADIGIPLAAHEQIAPTYQMTERATVLKHLKPRQPNSHKGNYGRLLNLAGSGYYTGAAALSTQAALRCGVGYVTLASTPQVCSIVSQSTPEAVLLLCKEGKNNGVSSRSLPSLLEQATKATAISMGCGLGAGTDIQAILRKLVAEATVPLILDADGINALVGHIDILKKARCPVILTPHPAELARLLGVSVSRLLEDQLTLGSQFASSHNVTLLLKGATTLVFAPHGKVWLISSGNPGMAKAGSGDVLTGMIGALAAQGLAPVEAAVCGAWLHGRAGSLAAEQYSQTSMLPSNIISSLGAVFLELGL